MGFIDTVIPKIESIIEYNRANHKNVKLKHPGQDNVVTLGDIESASLADMVKKDTNISESLVSKLTIK